MVRIKSPESGLMFLGSFGFVHARACYVRFTHVSGILRYVWCVTVCVCLLQNATDTIMRHINSDGFYVVMFFFSLAISIQHKTHAFVFALARSCIMATLNAVSNTLARPRVHAASNR